MSSENQWRLVLQDDSLWERFNWTANPKLQDSILRTSYVEVVKEVANGGPEWFKSRVHILDKIAQAFGLPKFNYGTAKKILREEGLMRYGEE